ncbi:MAG TPA: crossover junction endodeoxyribonuclease RuvC [Nitriliruptorales bacterium]|nr:crossover junction endodeoxyribonuclease RuvC [Nitriliruptorales bacterium]
MGHDLRVLGVDPGLTRCGLGVVQGPASRPAPIAAEVVRTARDLAVERRLMELHDAVADAIATHRPDVVACERVLFSSNARTAMGVGQAAGVALLAAARAGVTVASYSPTDVKLTVAGHGAAGKEAVGRMVAAQLRLDVIGSPADLTDALAVALCHLVRAGGSVPSTGRHRGWEAVLQRPHLRVAGGTGPSGMAT